ncbi:anti-phage-associated DUF1156 domain-containing protein [Neobacillus jeddahensis]|uniref:anti-phage-associated DUF1156 domain-containing protein n=1 Tax=Neobacillus jeddahensis TaxID=1461580 RepID=UPI00058DC62A|nr:anti-phage-associated DUF1156 domain-containing protein [Neobacillus jeddahensis]
MLDYTKSFIETQFPVSKISKESYKERRAGTTQTLTPLGKWWGRKPLILVRATLLGTLMPVSENPVKDREIFLKILTMDDEGLWLRKSKSLNINTIYSNLNKIERAKYFKETVDKLTYINEITKEEKEYLQKIVFYRLSYDEKLTYCERPENALMEDRNIWEEINEHLKTNAYSLQELTKQLGEKRFGHVPRVGDCFAGGGSIPFESARMGADVFSSDLNPLAALLNWSAINVVGTNASEALKLTKFLEEVFSEVKETVSEMRIDINEKGDNALSYLYCYETNCPECSYKVPLSPSWIIGKGTKTVAILKDNEVDGFEINIIENASKDDLKLAESLKTINNNRMFCPHCKKETPIPSLRGDKKNENGDVINGIRKWRQDEFYPNQSDIFIDRLYAIRYLSDKGKYYVKPTEQDFERERKVKVIMESLFKEWSECGYIPTDRIEDGYNTDQPKRERGFQYWHQLFNPRQLLLSGLISKTVNKRAKDNLTLVAGYLGLNRCLNFNSKLSRWVADASKENGVDTFYNQALNTIFNYTAKSIVNLSSSWFYTIHNSELNVNYEIKAEDARRIETYSDIWITDPPYADAVNYHELTEFFLSWNRLLFKKAFPDWYTDTKEILAVKGIGQSFNESMIEIYRNLANHMPDNGYQVVMFTHQDVKVWSELAMILWSAGLHVVSAWNVATETESGGLKSGNYVKGTVLLTLKKQNSNEMAFQDELYDEIKHEVKNIIDSMRELDDKDDPDFTDADYLLASYASSLKVLTAYKEIEGIDVAYWLSQPRDSKEVNPIEALINKAVRVAYDYLIPEGFDKSHWTDLKPEERFFIRGLELEMNGIYKISSYQELARGFGVSDYTDMFANFKANSARLKTPSEFKMAFLNNDGFGSTLLRHLLVAINETTKAQSTVEGRNYLKNAFNESNDYWYKKPLMSEILLFISKLEYINHMEHWKEHSYHAKLLREALKNEGV